jgi:hypothetical protein
MRHASTRPFWPGFSSHGIVHILTRPVLCREAIASGALWGVAGIFRWSDAGSENNAQATRAESAQTVLTETAQANPEIDRDPASVSVGRRPVASSKYENFASERCDCRR